MSEKQIRLVAVGVLAGLTLLASGTARANWSETFDGKAFELATWQFHCYPDLTKTFSATIKDGLDDNDYLALDETSSAAVGGSQFGIAFGSNEEFTDVRVGAVVNVTGGLRNYHGLGARATSFIDPDGSLTGEAPGVVASSYVMLIHWQDGPAHLRIEVFKIFNNKPDIMKTYHEEPVPGIGHARSYYAELDVVGSDPVYITGSLYEYKGGPLLARTPTLVDTGVTDPWENGGFHDAVFPNGQSAVFGMNRDNEPPGYHATFDTVSSISDGPAAVNPSPVDGATDLPVDVTLSWIEAEFATSRELWLGKPGQMQKVAPAPAGTTYTAALEFGQTYQWRIDQVGPSGTVTGYTWSFTTVECLSVDDFESYANDAGIRAAWVDNITEAGVEYVFLATDDDQSMRFEYSNQFTPYYTEATRTFSSPQNWAAQNVKAVSLSFYGEIDNIEQPMYLKLEDSAGHSQKVEHPYTHACEAERWEEWRVALSEFSDNGVDVSSIKKLTIGSGNGTKSAQPEEQDPDTGEPDRDFVFIDDIRLCPAGCLNVDQLDLRGDVNGDCKIDFIDFALMADGWLNDGLSAAP